MCIETYEKISNKFKEKIKQQKKYDLLLSVSRFITFITFGTLIYLFLAKSHNIALIYLALINFVLFVVSVHFNAKIKKKLKLLKEIKNINKVEIQHLKGNNTELKEGNEYINPEHDFSYDLDIFGANSLFQTINRTAILEGADKLAKYLTTPLKKIETIKLRQEAISELKNEVDWRQKFQALANINKLNEKKLPENFGELFERNFSKVLKWTIYILPTITIIAFILWITGILQIYIPFFMCFIQLIFVHFFSKKINNTEQKTEKLSKQFSSYISIIEHTNSKEFKSKLFKNIKQKLFAPQANALKAFNKLSFILNMFDQRRNFIFLIIGNGLFMSDLLLLSSVNKWYKRYGEHLNKWIDNLAQINALNSLSNFYFNNQEYTIPLFSDDYLLKAQDIGHPLIKKDKNKTNNFEIDQLNKIFIITGANMAGKSTFLRTVGVNLLLANIGSVVCAKKFCFQISKIFTSMRTTDNLAGNISYFHAELIRLKKLIEILKNAKKNEKFFIILDEILKGTNSEDKLKGSKLFLEKILNYPVSGLVATHDLALGKHADKFPQNFKNRCFEIDFVNDNVYYDYKLKEGITKNLNATFLLKKMIFDI